MREYTKSPLAALAMYHGTAVTAAHEWQTRITYYMQALLAALWVFSPFLSLPLFAYAPRRWFVASMHSMLLAAAFPIVLCLLLEDGLSTVSGPGGLLALRDLPKAYAALAQGALKHFDVVIHLFEVVIRIFELVLRVSKLFLQGLRTTRFHLQQSVASSKVAMRAEAPPTGLAYRVSGGLMRWTFLGVLDARAS
ncbi:hypothetical protein OH76DRAFT_1414706 [Lentinus brumalis]|uniref:Uncharacterized protein n=1 Tax=Lentinus brumalis TaxID=2498619 RepID=A0A371DRX4_9APHY|nr:hypothetical protein OH76DRAFT_1414706 [Polyporus brumalis]